MDDTIQKSKNKIQRNIDIWSFTLKGTAGLDKLTADSLTADSWLGYLVGHIERDSWLGPKSYISVNNYPHLQFLFAYNGPTNQNNQLLLGGSKLQSKL